MYNDEIYNVYKKMTAEIDGLTDEIINEVTENLKTKYECEFKVLKVGNRINTGSTTIHLCSESNEKVVFTAIIDARTNEIKDNYITKLIAEQIKNKCEQEFESLNISTACNIFINGDTPDSETNTQISIEDYMELYPVDSLFVYMAVNKECIDEKIADRLIQGVKKLSADYNKTIAVSGFVIDSDFDQCKTLLDTEPDASDTWFYDFDVVDSFKFAVTNGVCNMSSNDIIKGIRGC